MSKINNSVVIPVYNQYEQLKKVLKGFKEQTVDSDEYEMYKVYDSKGRKVYEFTTSKNAELIEGILKAGETYTFKEAQAPEHYKVAKDKKIRIRDTGKLQKLTVVDERIPEVPDTPQTGIKGKTLGMMISLISLLMALGCFACVRAKDKSKYNLKQEKKENEENN